MGKKSYAITSVILGVSIWTGFVTSNFLASQGSSYKTIAPLAGIVFPCYVIVIALRILFPVQRYSIVQESVFVGVCVATIVSILIVASLVLSFSDTLVSVTGRRMAVETNNVPWVIVSVLFFLFYWVYRSLHTQWQQIESMAVLVFSWIMYVLSANFFPFDEFWVERCTMGILIFSTTSIFVDRVPFWVEQMTKSR